MNRQSFTFWGSWQYMLPVIVWYTMTHNMWRLISSRHWRFKLRYSALSARTIHPQCLFIVQCIASSNKVITKSRHYSLTQWCQADRLKHLGGPPSHKDQVSLYVCASVSFTSKGLLPASSQQAPVPCSDQGSSSPSSCQWLACVALGFFLSSLQFLSPISFQVEMPSFVNVKRRSNLQGRQKWRHPHSAFASWWPASSWRR